MPTTGVPRMAEPPELWTFLVTNLIVLVIGGALAAFSFVAYRRDRESRFLLAAVGFALVTVGGGGVEPFYQTIFKGGYALGGRELLAMQSVEAFVVAAGLALLFAAIYTTTSRTRELRVDWQDPDEPVNE